MKKGLKCKLIPAVLYLQKYVNGDDECDYQKYLIQILNVSKHFMELSRGEKYERPLEEAHGECDAITKNYRIDFKLLESSSMLEGKRQYSIGIHRLCDGVTSYTESARKGRTIVTLLHVALREVVSFDEIDFIVNSFQKGIQQNKRTLENMDEQIKKDLQYFYRNMSTNKNLFWFIPEEFFFENESHEEAVEIEEIRVALSKDYSLSCKYRNQKVNNKDTYFCCLHKGCFLIFKFEESELKFIEKIATQESSIFTELSARYEMI